MRHLEQEIPGDRKQNEGSPGLGGRENEESLFNGRSVNQVMGKSWKEIVVMVGQHLMPVNSILKNS